MEHTTANDISVETPIEEVIRKRFPDLIEQGLKDELAEHGRLMEVPEGTILVDLGGHIRTIPLLVSGSLKVTREDEEGHELLLYYIDPGSTCAVSLTCCLGQAASQIRATSEDTALMVSIPAEFMDQWMTKYRSWREYVLKTYSMRFEELLATVDSIAFMRMDQRLIRYLEDKARAHNSNELSTTHQEIAWELNSSREVISRLLKQLERIGRIKLGRNRITLINE